MVRRASRAPTQRQLRVGEEIRHSIAWALERGEVRDHAIVGVAITVTEVRISPDLKNATAFVTPLGGGDQEAVTEVTDGLNRAAPFFRRMIAKQLELRAVPRLKFISDMSFDKASEIDALMRRADVARDLRPMVRGWEENNPEESIDGDTIDNLDIKPNGA
jgi:ribosome-binding factor A